MIFNWSIELERMDKVTLLQIEGSNKCFDCISTIRLGYAERDIHQ